MISKVEIAPGIFMPSVGLGTWRISGSKSINLAVDAALEAGYRFFDTARSYENEEDLGLAFKTLLPQFGLKREDIFVTTKLFAWDMGKIPAQEALKSALEKLGMDYVDLYLVHHPKPHYLAERDPKIPTIRRKVWEEMERCLENGATRSIGVSNYEVSHLKEFETWAKIQPAVNQVEFHPHFTRNDILEYCRSHGIHFQAFAPLGRMAPELVSEDVIEEMVRKYKTGPSNVLLAWALAQGISVVPKSGNPDRIRTNLEAMKVNMCKEDVEAIRGLNRNVNYTGCYPWRVI